mgnify:CR=1 FL=1
MTTDQQTAAAAVDPTQGTDYFAQLGEQFDQVGGANDVFARTERKFIGRIEVIETTAMPEDILERRQVDTKADWFKAAYPQGLPALHIAVKGVSVKFVGVADEMLHIWVPLYGDAPETAGKAKGRRSHAHIIGEAFQAVFKFRPFGTTNQQKLRGAVVLWGQHLGSMAANPATGAEAREWAWDIPRGVLPATYEHTDPVTEINIGRQSEGTDAVQGAGGVAGLSREESIEAVLGVIVGGKIPQALELTAKALEIPGLHPDIQSAGFSGGLLKLLGDEGFIVADEDGETINRA